MDGTAGEHNLPYSAFESVFLADIASRAKEKGAKEIKIVQFGVESLQREADHQLAQDGDRNQARSLRDILNFDRRKE